MPELLREISNQVLYLTFNRVEKHNAFDEIVLNKLQAALEFAQNNPEIHLIVIRANGKYFCAGADLNWMQRLGRLDEAENRRDALLFANTLHSLYTSQKPTLAIVQGSAFGGGVGILAACDLVIAAHSACFCFPEVSLGLIPAVISPYVIRAIGVRAAQWLFMTKETITATRAQELTLIHHVVDDERLSSSAQHLIATLTACPLSALIACKHLIQEVYLNPIDNKLIEHTAELISQLRTSAQGQQGMRNFFNKQKNDD